MAREFPARLHILLASEARVGVVFRRGPANAVCTVRWDRETDTFEIGQWFRGRIYERRSDLSADGRHLIYFARGGRRHEETKGSWTAISRAPWLHAVTRYGKGDCWQGGGLFTSNEKYWLNGCHFLVRQDAAGLGEDSAYQPEGSFGAECPSVYYRRLLRDGWQLEIMEGPGRVSRCTVFAKPQNGFVDASRDLLLGAGLEWFNVQHWVAAEQEGMAATLAPVDAPMVTLGGDIARGVWPTSFRSRKGTIFSYIMSNYTPEAIPRGRVVRSHFATC